MQISVIYCPSLCRTQIPGELKGGLNHLMISPLQYSIPWNWQRFGSLQWLRMYKGWTVPNVSFEPYSIHMDCRKRSIILEKQRQIITAKKPVKLAQDPLSDEEAHACANLGNMIVRFHQRKKVCGSGWYLSLCPPVSKAKKHLKTWNPTVLSSKDGQHLAWTVDSISHLAHQSGSPVNSLFYYLHV